MKSERVILVKSIVTAVIFLSVCVKGVFAEGGEQGRMPSGIQREDRVMRILDSIERIDPEQVDDAELKEVGEIVMKRIIADPAARAWINETMGGQNSECLKDMYIMIGYRFLHDRRSLQESTIQNRFSAGHAFMKTRIRGEDVETGRSQIGAVPLMGYLMLLFLFISALGSLLFMIRLFQGRV